MDETREAIRQLLQKALESNNDSDAFGDGDSLILSGRLQSVDVLNIVLFLEERFGLDFSEDFDEQRLDSVEEIMNLLRTSEN